MIYWLLMHIVNDDDGDDDVFFINEESQIS